MNDKIKLLYFYSDSCHACIYVSNVLNSNKINVVYINVNDETSYDLAFKYDISSVPTIIVCSDDTEIGRIIAGKYKENELINEIKKYYELS